MAAASPPTVSLVVVNYEASALCASLVSSVAGDIDEVIVVDNASTDTAALESLSQLPHVEILRLSDNRGYGAGANAGRARAHGDVIVVANPDVTITAAALRELAEVALDVGIAGPRFIFPDGSLQRSAHRKEPVLATTLVELCPPVGGVARRIDADWHPTLFRTRDHRRDLEVSHLLGALMAVDARAWDEVGGFDETFFLYREETDLCRRVAGRGWRICYVPSVIAEHIGGASSPPDPPLTARPTWLASHYRYIAKHKGPRRAAVARVLGTAASAATMLQRKRRATARVTLAWHLDRARRSEPRSRTRKP